MLKFPFKLSWLLSGYLSLWKFKTGAIRIANLLLRLRYSCESIEQALHRESGEELGIINKEFSPLYSYIMRNDIESELVHTFLLKDDGPFIFDKQEITEIRFWERSEIEKNLGIDVFTPNFEEEYAMLVKAL